MPILNYTTKIDYFKTIGEIQQVLTKSGCKKIVVDFQDSKPIGMTFTLQYQEREIAFAMPCRFDGVLRTLKKNKKVPKSLCTEEQAIRVGWRIILNWIESQMAMVEAETASMAEIFPTWAVTSNGETISERVLNNSEGRGVFLLQEKG